MSDFVICIKNEGDSASLIVGKVYRRLHDAQAESHNLLRVMDEDGAKPDSYPVPAAMCAPIEIPESVQRVLSG